MSNKDYRVLVKVKNANILRALERAGFTSVSAFCRGHKLSQSSVGELINLRVAPVSGYPLRCAEQLSVALNVPIWDLFSDEQMTPLEKNTSQADVSLDDMLPMIAGAQFDPLQRLVDDDNKVTIDAVLATGLTPREEQVIRSRCGLDGEAKTLFQLGEELGVTRERVRQIELKALRRLRLPMNKKHLLPLL